MNSLFKHCKGGINAALLALVLILGSCSAPPAPAVRQGPPAPPAEAPPEIIMPPETTQGAEDSVPYTPAPPTTTAATAPPATTAPPTTTAPPPAPPREPAELTSEALLYDFDYFARILRENYPFFGVARRKFGVDLHAQLNAARAAVTRVNTARSDAQILADFAEILRAYVTSPMRTLGHLRGLWAGSSAHEIQLALIALDGSSELQWYPNLYARHMSPMFTSPTAARYYGRVILEQDDIDRILRRDYIADNIAFDIIEPGHIAYIRMNSMNSANFGRDGRLIAEFFDGHGGLEGFGHLIVDLRGNRGGRAANFTSHIMAPLIDEPAVLSYYVFFKGGEHALFYDYLYYLDMRWQLANGLLLHEDAPRFAVSEILPQLTQANAADFAYLSYGFRRDVIVNPAASRRPFDGQVWVLVDGLSVSAAEISAFLAKESGFATVVGSNTAGVFGGYTAAFIGLPNTGIIMRYDYGYVTDRHGRSLEEFGVTPQVRNRPGMDALATVLAIIAEG